jgi:hypothetical protein
MKEVPNMPSPTTAAIFAFFFLVFDVSGRGALLVVRAPGSGPPEEAGAASCCSHSHWKRPDSAVMVCRDPLRKDAGLWRVRAWQV